MLLLTLFLSFAELQNDTADALFPVNCNDIRLLGEWQIYYIEDGRGRRSIAHGSWMFGAKEYQIDFGGDVRREYAYSIDSTAIPLRMTVEYVGNEMAIKKSLPKTIKCIYTFKDNKMVRCLSLNSDEYPSSFITHEGNGLELQVFMRPNSK